VGVAFKNGASFTTMHELGIRIALTFDGHFRRALFEVVLDT
jgi:predicted nucleic acid-binding protein